MKIQNLSKGGYLIENDDGDAIIEIRRTEEEYTVYTYSKHIRIERLE